MGVEPGGGRHPFECVKRKELARLAAVAGNDCGKQRGRSAGGDSALDKVAWQIPRTDFRREIEQRKEPRLAHHGEWPDIPEQLLELGIAQTGRTLPMLGSEARQQHVGFPIVLKKRNSSFNASIASSGRPSRRKHCARRKSVLRTGWHRALS